MTDNIKVFGCYICGKKPSVDLTDEGYNIYCSNEKCPGVSIAAPIKNLDQAVEKWNLINSLFNRK